jgi:hypothetical protein
VSLSITSRTKVDAICGIRVSLPGGTPNWPLRFARADGEHLAP